MLVGVLLVTRWVHNRDVPKRDCFAKVARARSFQPFIDAFGTFSITSIVDYPKFFFLKAIETNGQYPLDAAAIGNIAMIYIPIGVVELAQHIADHKNISSIVETDLLVEPGLHRTLLGDGIGSMVGAVFGGAPNTTYGESIACVAISGNASVATIVCTAVLAIIIAFLSPFATFLASIPSCVMGGVCISLYGFIAVSGLKMIQKIDLEDNKNLFVVSVILIAGIGGLFVFLRRRTRAIEDAPLSAAEQRRAEKLLNQQEEPKS